jgi:hypothetical protein
VLKELGNSVKVILYDRAVSPLSGVFALVWLGFNWKALAVLILGRDDIVTRITYIDAHYVDVWRNVYYPAIVSAGVLLLYPFIALAAYALWEKVSTWKTNLKQRFEDTVALPLAKSLALRREMKEQEKQYADAMESRDARIAELQSTNQNLSSELAKLKESLSKGSALEIELGKRVEELSQAQGRISALSDQVSRKDAELRSRESTMQYLETRVKTLEGGGVDAEVLQEERKILAAIANAEEKEFQIDEADAVREAGLSKVEGRYYVDRLVDKKLIFKASNKTGREHLFLHPAGREQLVRLKREHDMKRKP